MSVFDGLKNRLRALVARAGVERDLDDELRFHLEESEARNRRAGMDPAEARRAARIALGGVESVKERVRDERGTRLLEDLAQDLRIAARSLAHNLGFTAVAVTTLALGIGASAAIYSVLQAVVLAPLPFPDPDRLVSFGEVSPQGDRFSTSAPNFLDLRAQAKSFVDVAAFGGAPFTLTGDGEPERLRGARVTASFFDVLGARPLLGRTFTAEEVRPGAAAPVVVLSHGLWGRRFGADPAVVGRALVLGGEPYTVIGVLAPGFDFPDTDVWAPLAPDPAASRGDHRLAAFGRLRPGVPIERAREEVTEIAADLAIRYPESNRGWGAYLQSFADWIIGPRLTRTLFLLTAAVGLLVLIACANVSNLLLVRAAARRRELGMRAALGAGRRRLVRQLLSESALLAALGGGAGLALAAAAVPLLTAFGPRDIPRLDEVRLDGGVLGVTLGLCLLTVFACGLAPALQGTGVDLREVLATGGRTAGGGGGRRLQRALVAVEVALAVVVLVGAGLLTASFRRLRQVDPGFRAGEVLAVPVALTGAAYSGDGARARFVATALERLSTLPGVTAAAATNVLPLDGGSTAQEVSIEGHAAASPAETAFADWRAVTPDLFATLGTSLIAGRDFTAGEAAQPAQVAVVNRRLAEQAWPGEDPLGRHLAFGVGGTNWFTVVGVVEDFRDVDLAADPRPTVFVPYAITNWATPSLLVRARGEPTALVEEIRREIRALDPELPLPRIAPLTDQMAGVFAGPRFQMLLMDLFAVLALVLAVVGLYGLISYSVAQRRREIGVRMALGAGTAGVGRMVLAEGLTLGGAGVAAGLLAAAAVTRLVASLLFEVSPTDPGTFATVALVLLAATLLASWLPAARAAAVDPARVLRSD